MGTSSKLQPTYAVLDVETTGKDPTCDVVVEIGACLYRDGLRIATFETLVNPERPIPASASGIHHIRDRDVVGAPKIQDALRALSDFVADASVYVAHNADFDAKFLLDLPARPWLCTLRLARHLWPSADDFKNQTLRYYLDVDDADLTGVLSHRALADTFVTAGILCKALDQLRVTVGQRSLQWLLAYARRPIEVATMPRGNASTKGKSWSELTDRDLWYWLGREDLDQDLRWNTEQELYIRLADSICGNAA